MCALAGLLLLAACVDGNPSDPGGTASEWQGTVTTEGDVTTVVNESGSFWGGTATLVEEVSIGVEAGADEYMFGTITDVAASDDRIYVVDMQVPAVRIYDHDGSYVGDLGRSGEGPGEYGYPDSIVVASDGRIFLRDRQPGRITAFPPDGTVDATFQVPGGLVTSTPIGVTPDGVPHSPQRVGDRDAAVWRMGMTPYGEEGPVGDPLVPPDIGEETEWLAARRPDGSARSSSPVPFAPTLEWAMAPSGAMIAGMPGEYRFEVHRPDGSVLVVESQRERVPVLEGEAAWHERRLTAWFRRRTPDWTWNGPPIPEKKPAYTELIPSQSGETWVVVPGRGQPVADCTEDPEPGEDVVPCWEEEQGVDVFGEDGRYLGPVDVPGSVRLWARSWIDGQTVIVPVENEMGTLMVKRYQLVLPEESSR